MNWKFWIKKEEEPADDSERVLYDYEEAYPLWPYRVVEMKMKSGKTYYQVNKVDMIRDYFNDDVKWTDWHYPTYGHYTQFDRYENKRDACDEAQELHFKYNDKIATTTTDVSCEDFL